MHYDHAYDDAINASNSITISGGSVYVYAVNNDGIDSNGTLTISGGLVIASGTTGPGGNPNNPGNPNGPGNHPW